MKYSAHTEQIYIQAQCHHVPQTQQWTQNVVMEVKNSFWLVML
jgi:hypothetical protein